MTVAGLQGGSAKHATGVPGQGTYEDLLRRGACAVPAPDVAEAARHADLGPARGPVDRAHEPRRVHEGLQQHQRMMKPCRPVPHQMARAQRTRDPRLGTGRRSRNRVLLATRCSRVLVAQRPANPRVTRLALQRAAENAPAPPTRRATDTTASRPPSAPPQGNDASPSQHGTAPPPRATPHRASAKARSRPRSDQPLCQEDLYRNSSRKSTPKRIRLESRRLSQNKNPPWAPTELALTLKRIPIACRSGLRTRLCLRRVHCARPRFANRREVRAAPSGFSCPRTRSNYGRQKCC